MTGPIAERIAGRSPVRDGLALSVVAFVAASYVAGFVLGETGQVGRDLAVCQREVQAWLGGAPMYPGFEVQGPFQLSAFGLILYPPITTALFAPTLLLPLPLWWLIPAAIVGTIVYRLRPGSWWLLALGLCLAYPTSVNLVVAGNPDMWIAAALAVAVYWRPAAAFVLLKPSVFPLALIGLRSRGWWVVVGIFAVVSLLLLPQTLDWLAVLRNGQGGLRAGGLLYSMQDLPLLAVPLVAWAGSARRAPAAAGPIATISGPGK
jgi:hypothetical protein